jgi:hypothetical protein
VISVRFIGDFTDSQRQTIAKQLEDRWGSARCDVHGEPLRFIVSPMDAECVPFGGRFVRVWPACGICFLWNTCCDDFDLTIRLEFDRECERELRS